MPEAVPHYTKLPGRGTGLDGSVRLWMGEDHLLAVSSYFIFERYARYHFEDIRGLIVQRTRLRATLNAVLGVIALFGLLFVFIALGVTWLGWVAVEESTLQFLRALLLPAASLAAAIAVAALIALLINTLRGPSCRCHLLLPTGRVTLAAPSRLKDANHLLTLLSGRLGKEVSA